MTDCPTCEGAGRVPVYSGPCHGVLYERPVLCEECGGTGRVIEEVEEEE